MIDPTIPLACPLDGLALTPSGNSWRCAGNHCYDVARDGYLNLLPVRYKPSKDPGDSRAMIAARRRVLDAGVFEPLGRTVAEQVQGHVRDPMIEARSGAMQPLVLDAGCGEGHYTEQLRRLLDAREDTQRTQVLGVDISRWAITAAAKRHKGIAWVVANNRRLPILQGRCDVITSLFGFETWRPWAELQHRGQLVLMAHAGPLHLIELRKAIYSTVRVHAPPDDKPAREAGYERVGDFRLTDARTVAGDTLWNDIFLMTPHGHRASRPNADVKADMNTGLGERMAGKALTLDVQLRWYRRS